MPRRSWAAVLLVALMLCVAEGRAEEMIFRKQVAPEASIVVKRSLVDAGVLASINAKIAQENGRASTVTVELHLGDQQAVVASTVFVEYPDFRQGFRVLDIATAEGDIVLACSTYDLVSLWKIPTDAGLAPKPAGWVRLLPSQYATRSPLNPGDVEVELVAPRDGSWSVKVSDKRITGSPTRVFRQVKDSWEFVAIGDKE